MEQFKLSGKNQISTTKGDDVQIPGNWFVLQDDEQDGLLKQFTELKNLLISIEDLRLIDPNVFLAPFLDVIRSEETTGQITSLALSALNKFLSYGLIGKSSPLISLIVGS